MVPSYKHASEPSSITLSKNSTFDSFAFNDYLGSGPYLHGPSILLSSFWQYLQASLGDFTTST
jgi:hypothetical protein